LTFANVVSLIALFVALGGSSYAALTVTGRNVKNSSLTGRDVKNNSLTGSDVKNLRSVDIKDASLQAKDFARGQLPAGPQGIQGIQGIQGPPGTALAYARVDSTGNVDEARAKNITDANVSSPMPGLYCFDGLPFTAKNVVATPDAALRVWISATLGGGFNCEADDDAVIDTGDPGSVFPAAHHFSVLFN
jgi:hypothetical protein